MTRSTGSVAGVDAAPLRLEGSLDFAATLEPLRRDGDDLLDRWDGGRLLRTATVPAGGLAYAVEPTGSRGAPAVRVTAVGPGGADAPALARQAFAPVPAGLDALLARDAVLASLAARFPGHRPLRQPDLFTALVRAISAQQVNLRWAATTRRRLAEAFGERWTVLGEPVYRLDPEVLAAVDPADIRALQFTTRKAEYIVGVAQEIAAGRLSLAALEALPDEAVIERLAALRGIGRWTAEWILVRTLGRARVVAGDLGVRKAVGGAYAGGRLPAESEVRALTAHWGRCAELAQALLLQGLAAGVLAVAD